MTATKQKRSVKRWLVCVGGVLLAAGLACGAAAYGSYHRHLRLPDTLQAQMDLLPDTNAQTGTPTADAAPSEGGADSFQVIINQTPTVAVGQRACRIRAENPESNPYDLRICLYLEETGELLGATHLIQRGKRLDEMTLEQTLEEGSYPIIAKLELFDEAQEPVSQLALNLTLLVRE